MSTWTCPGCNTHYGPGGPSSCACQKRVPPQPKVWDPWLGGEVRLIGPLLPMHWFMADIPPEDKT